MTELAANNGTFWQESEDGLLAMLIALGKTNEEAAKEAGLGVRTVYRRLSDPGFNLLVRRCRAALFAETFGKIVALQTAALDALKDLLTAKNEAVRLGAVRLVLEQGREMYVAQDLVERIEALEQEQGLSDAHGTPHISEASGGTLDSAATDPPPTAASADA